MEEVKRIIKSFKENGNLANLAGMQRFGIRFDEAFGCNIPFLRRLAKEYKNNHELALELWKTGIHEARILSFLIDEPAKVTEKQMEMQLKDVKSWDICDGLCSNLFRKTEFAYEKALEWSYRSAEFEKRAGFVMMAVMAVHDKKMCDDDFNKFFERIISESTDDRNFVKKAVNWALRQIGKRNDVLHKKAIEYAERIAEQDSRTAKWIAKDALREFQSETTKRVLANRKKRQQVL